MFHLFKECEDVASIAEVNLCGAKKCSSKAAGAVGKTGSEIEERGVPSPKGSAAARTLLEFCRNVD
jgi:hypothetical protein